ncbi:hypothetical protein ACWDCB_12070 [Streptomyces sp. NPDC001178]
MTGRRTYDLVTAVHESVVNAVRYGGGHGLVRLCRPGLTPRRAA